MSAISITRALAEIKLLDKRITDGTNSLNAAKMVVKGKVLAGYASPADFISQADASIQSISDLIVRRNKIKSAIVASNATTNVTLAGKGMTVAEAIERKTSIAYDKSLLTKLSGQLTQARASVESHNVRVREAANAAAVAILGSDAKKQDPSAYQQNFDAYMARNEYEVISATALDKLSNALKKDIEDFECEVDFILSESNTRTTIEV
jgi:predicted solute-binding protein